MRGERAAASADGRRIKGVTPWGGGWGLGVAVGSRGKPRGGVIAKSVRWKPSGVDESDGGAGGEGVCVCAVCRVDCCAVARRGGRPTVDATRLGEEFLKSLQPVPTATRTHRRMLVHIISRLISYPS